MNVFPVGMVLVVGVIWLCRLRENAVIWPYSPNLQVSFMRKFLPSC